jgi:hypothetical protein
VQNLSSSPTCHLEKISHTILPLVSLFNDGEANSFFSKKKNSGFVAFANNKMLENQLEKLLLLASFT